MYSIQTFGAALAGAFAGAVAASKFAGMEHFGKTGKGHICLQDHGDEVAYRNIKIRKL